MHRTPRLAVLATAALIASPTAAQVRLTLEQAAPVLAALPSMPAELRSAQDRHSRADGERAWTAWVDRHDRDVRARVARGDEDSVVNFWLYGTGFTSHPPAVVRPAMPASQLDVLVEGRLDDFLDAVASPGNDERLTFARRVLSARDADPSRTGSRQRARRFLVDARRRMMREFTAADRELEAARRDGAGALAAANATIFRDRGLSSDTSILSDYSVSVALAVMREQGTLSSRSVRHVAIVGPGLDFTNKADGYDFYPQQTLQPFALIDTLRRLDLSAPDLRVTTFDINPRVNHHLSTAVERAAAGHAYTVTLPLDADTGWENGLLEYWGSWGRTIGEEIAPVRPPDRTGDVRTRTVRIRPAIAGSIVPRDLNIVVDRLDLTGDEPFDLVVATNVLVYYGVVEQALAAANIAAMLRPGGVLLTNNAVFPTPPLQPAASYVRVTHTAHGYDDVFWYRRN